METVKVSKGKKFINRGERLKALYVLLQGSVKAAYRREEWIMEPGSILGIGESGLDMHLFDYMAETDCLLYAYEYTQPKDYYKIFSNEEKYVSVFTMAAVRQTANTLKRYQGYYTCAKEYYGTLMELYQEYEKLCADYHVTEKGFQRIESARPFVATVQISDCIVDFYHTVAGMSLKTMETFLARKASIGTGEILNAADWMVKALSQMEEIKDYLLVQKELLLSNTGDDLYKQYFELAKKAASDGMELLPVTDVISKLIDYARNSQLYTAEMMELEFERYESFDFYENKIVETEIWQEEEQFGDKIDYLKQILRYAEYEGEVAANLIQDLETYKSLPDMLSTSEEVRLLRRSLSNSFYDIYKKIFKRAMESYSLSPVIKMFLNFGFIDKGLVGEDTTDSLYDIADELFLCKAPNVYTIYEWLKSIYDGINEPSRNDFELDYAGYLQEQRKTGKIDDSQFKELQNDNWQKVLFEIDNMFVTNNRTTYGKISIFCPLLCEQDIINSVENMLVTAEKVNAAIDYIRGVDFSIFYREVIFSDPNRNINREMIQKEVLPQVILMPNAGSRAMMWQETAGIKRDTPARFILPILTVADVSEMMIEVAGRFRWEMCRKIQGVRWNDISDPSLTSIYGDYVQYYRKNHDLSADAREKVKNALYKAKNNFREVFVKDYQSWIKYESKGSFRLNKVSREILFRYCPFSKAIRNELRINPLYQELFDKYDIIVQRSRRRVELLYDRYLKKGGEITPELQTNMDFFDL